MYISPRSLLPTRSVVVPVEGVRTNFQLDLSLHIANASEQILNWIYRCTWPRRPNKSGVRGDKCNRLGLTFVGTRFNTFFWCQSRSLLARARVVFVLWTVMRGDPQKAPAVGKLELKSTRGKGIFRITLVFGFGNDAAPPSLLLIGNWANWKRSGVKQTTTTADAFTN